MKKEIHPDYHEINVVMTDGSTFGSIIQGGNNGHIVVGIKDNDINDSFSIVSGSGNFMTDTTYDKNIFKADATGRIFLDSSGYFYSGNGTEGSPSISFTSDQDTGLYRPSSNALASFSGQISVDTAGDIRSDFFRGATYPTNSFLDFDDDAGSVATNSITLASVASMDFIIDTNANGTDDKFVFGRDAVNADATGYTQLMELDNSGNLTLIGQLNATTKSFDIKHPTQEGKRLRYGVLEGPEHGVYVRGKSNSHIIELPEEWTGLVHEDSITVQLTAIGKAQELYVENIEDNKIYIGSERTIENYFYYVQAERKDVDKIETVYDDK